MSEYDKLEYETSSGAKGAERLTSGTTTNDYVGIKAINNDVTFGSDCEVSAGDPPENGDVLQQGDILMLPFSQVDIDSGVAFAYIRP